MKNKDLHAVSRSYYMSSSNSRNQAAINDGRVDIQTKNANYGGNGNRHAGRQNKDQVANAGNAQDEAGGILNDEENDFMLDNACGDETLEELIAVVVIEANASHIDLISSMTSKGVHEHANHKKLKTVIHTSDDDQIDYNIIFDDPYVKNNASEETLEDAEESRLKIKNKLIQLNYAKLNAIYESFVPQKEFSAEQTYFSTPSTSMVSSESSKEILDLQTPKMSNESKLLKMFDKLDEAILALRTNIDVTLLQDDRRIYINDGQNTLRQFYKTDVIPMSLSLIKFAKELKQELTVEVQEMLYIFESMEKKVETQPQKDNMFQNEIDQLLEASFTREIKDYVLIFIAKQKNEILMLEKEKISSDSKDIQANLLKRIKIIKNDFKRSQAQSIDFELNLEHQKEKMACDNSQKSKLTKLSDENVFLKTQVESVVQEREHIIHEYQTLFNSIKATRA
ncbi:hypothetical protein Tco_0616059 [Tanacetum coccineum]